MKDMKKINSILYVEDEKSVQNELAEFLEDFCDKLYVADDGLEGLELYKKHQPKIVVTDIRMPQMDGIELAKNLFELNSDIHIIFLTAFTDLEYLQKAIEIHADGYIIKPIDLEKLESLLIKTIRIELLNKQLEKKTQYELKKKAELETILATTLDGIAILDFTTHFLYTNNAFEHIVGFDIKEIKSLKAIDITIDEDKNRFKEVISTVIKNHHVEHFQQRVINKDGKKIILDISLTLMPDKNRILIATKDITKEIYSKDKINEYMQIIDENVITSSTDLSGVITYVSNAFCKVTGYEKEELIGKKHNIIRNPQIDKNVYKQLWKTIKQNQIWTGEIKNKTKKGEDYWVYLKIYPNYDENGEKIGYSSIHHNITNLKIVEELATIDSLTQVYNRHFFNQTFESYINGAKRDDKLVCFVMFDIDYFKQYNDTYGHQKGDEALKIVAQTIKKSLHRDDDFIFRLGGEEFGVLFKPLSVEKGIEFAKIIVKSIEDLKVKHENNNISPYLTISAGLVCKKAKDIKNINKVYNQADELLYNAKAQGRNKLVSNFSKVKNDRG
ncbi:diguanylate cyclase domain-containing protein [Halarcobacter sp.]|uniref:diguanylate cyclase domain-containing protein n=1 Tax=Halarcobacter sp. TaxID=2321133 RepID=UPI003A8CCF7C